MSKPSGVTAESDSCSSDGCSGADALAFGTRCPVSGTVGLSVNRITLKALLTPDALRRLDETPYFFCPAPDCNVVYFSTQNTSFFTRADLTIRVGLKEREHPIPLCYCFGYTLADVQQDLAARGTTDIPAVITEEIRAGHCACEVRNPQGTCCLGNVTAAVKTTSRTDKHRTKNG